MSLKLTLFAYRLASEEFLLQRAVTGYFIIGWLDLFLLYKGDSPEPLHIGYWS